MEVLDMFGYWLSKLGKAADIFLKLQMANGFSIINQLS